MAMMSLGLEFFGMQCAAVMIYRSLMRARSRPTQTGFKVIQMMPNGVQHLIHPNSPRINVNPELNPSIATFTFAIAQVA